MLFPRKLNPFSFTPPKQPNLSAIAQEKQAIIRQYYGILDFFRNYIFKFEEIHFKSFFNQREDLYKKYSLEEMLKDPLPSTPRVPFNIFNIWLTDEANPKELDPRFLEIMKNNSRKNSRLNGWNYYFLVQDPELLPATKAALENTDIQMIKYTDILTSLDMHSEFTEALAEKNFGKASDILRVEAIRKLGGIYLDIDLQIFHSLKLYCYLYDSMFGIQPMDEYLGNAFIACSPNHPIMEELVNLIKRNCRLIHEKTTLRNLSEERQKQVKAFYGNLSSRNDKANIVLTTGPCALTIAFYKAAGKSTIDIALPPEALFPGKTLDRPTNEILEIGEPLGINSLCVHYWSKTWI